jgi:hypothetical protein
MSDKCPACDSPKLWTEGIVLRFGCGSEEIQADVIIRFRQSKSCRIQQLEDAIERVLAVTNAMQPMLSVKAIRAICESTKVG